VPISIASTPLFLVIEMHFINDIGLCVLPQRLSCPCHYLLVGITTVNGQCLSTGHLMVVTLMLVNIVGFYCRGFVKHCTRSVCLCLSVPKRLFPKRMLLFLCTISLAFHLLFGPRAASLLLN